MAAIKAVSFERYNGGAAIKRQYGSSTVTKFYVFRAEDEKDASKYVVVKGYGPTPGDRKTDAIRRSGLLSQGTDYPLTGGKECLTSKHRRHTP